jgi:Leucine-rich repeat (LRR) protein
MATIHHTRINICIYCSVYGTYHLRLNGHSSHDTGVFDNSWRFSDSIEDHTVGVYALAVSSTLPQSRVAFPAAPTLADATADAVPLYQAESQLVSCRIIMSMADGMTCEPPPEAPPREPESSARHPEEQSAAEIPVADEVIGSSPNPVEAEPMPKQPFPRRMFGVICLASIALIVGLSVGLSTKSANVPADSGLQTIPVTTETMDSFRTSLPSEFSDVVDRPETPAGKAFEWLLQHSELLVYNETDAVMHLTQRFALAAFYYSMTEMGSASWIQSDGWLNHSQYECEWFGCSCGVDNRTISSIHLDNNGLTGRFSSPEFELSLLREGLVTLAIDGNSKVGGPIARELGSLNNLKYLAMNANRLSGSLPSELSKLSQLEVLLLAQNGALSGSLPAWLGDMTMLRGFAVNQNSLVGTLPSQLGLMTNLELLWLYENNLSGSLPPDLGALSRMSDVMVHNNTLNGTIPSEIGRMSALTSLTLDFNQLDGTLPSSLGRLSQLKWLSMKANQLNGPLPSELAQLSRLEVALLTRNLLSGSLPTDLGLLKRLSTLDLMYNQFRGAIPTEIGNMSSIMDLELGDNAFSGTIPTEFGLLENLRVLVLGNSNISGSVPTEIAALFSLNFLNISGTELSGRIPTEIGRLSLLETLEISNNARLSGTIPTEVGELASLNALRLHRNGLTGTIPTELGSLSSLTTMWLQQNSLNGTIPSELASLTGLNDLRVSSNLLSGSVPNEVCALVTGPNEVLTNVTIDCERVVCRCGCVCGPGR